MKYLYALITSVVLLVMSVNTQPPAIAQDGMKINLGDHGPALHSPVGSHIVWATPAFEDYIFMFFDLCEAMELKINEDCKIYPMNAEIGINAIATEQDGNRLIVYDRRLSPLVGYEGAMMIIAHELGHHFCRHIGKTSDPKQELEADQFAGAAMRRAGYSSNQALSAVPILSKRPSKSHPARGDRIAAITAGWNEPANGKACR